MSRVSGHEMNFILKPHPKSVWNFESQLSNLDYQHGYDSQEITIIESCYFLNFIINLWGEYDKGCPRPISVMYFLNFEAQLWGSKQPRKPRDRIKFDMQWKACNQGH